MTYAFVTGASSGIGAAFARRFAQQGHDLVLVGRRRDRLEALALELERTATVRADVLVVDLARQEDLARAEGRLATLRGLAILVNAAGFVTVGHFADLTPERHEEILRVHVEAAVRLTRAGLPALLARGDDTVINVASIGAFLPTAGNATYAGTKAFLVAWTRALHQELRGSGVRVQALCPGFTRTEIYDRPELQPLAIAATVPPFLWTSPEVVVEASLRALARNRVVCIPDRWGRLLVLAGQIGLLPLLSAFVERATLAGPAGAQAGRRGLAR